MDHWRPLKIRSTSRCKSIKLPSLAKSSSKSSFERIVAPTIGSGSSSTALSFVSNMVAYTGSAKTFSSSDIERATDNFNTSRILGEGGFGRVYSGVLEDGTKVAVKQEPLSTQYRTLEYHQGFLYWCTAIEDLKLKSRRFDSSGIDHIWDSIFSGNMDKEWMRHSRESETYVVGVDMFLNFAFRNVVTRWGEILCPCRDCVNGMFQSRIACRDHLIIRGFMPNYTVWRVHGEALASSSVQNENDNEPEVAGAGMHGMLGCRMICRMDSKAAHQKGESKMRLPQEDHFL
ncbi:hypothetical protein RJ639_041997 [Escallonia herrerae]|uniref:Transposase-associated domain-containing protein n=1 Tax=Escallonia herrerae TaxID=1293975 RepID=A0AA88WSS1_9ASTE|nr:hypothetical protein RJ639_041997 [Escallonia herrerae]